MELEFLWEFNPKNCELSMKIKGSQDFFLTVLCHVGRFGQKKNKTKGTLVHERELSVF